MATPTSMTGPASRAVRRTAVAAACGLVGVLLAGCSNGFNAQTDEIYQPGPGITVRQDGVFLLNAAIITDGQGNGTLVGALLDQSKHPDSLIAVHALGSKPPQATIIAGPMTLPSHQSVQLADSGYVRFTGTLATGSFMKITLRFKNGTPITTQVPVLPNTGDFAKVPVGRFPGSISPTGGASS